MSLSEEDFVVINRVIKRVYAARDLDSFIVAAMRELPKVMTSDVASYNEVDYRRRRMMTVIDSPDGQRTWHRIQTVFEPIMNQNPLIEYNSQDRGQPKRVSDFLSQDEWKGLSIYKRVYAEVKGEHQIAVALPIQGNAIVAFAFNRRETDFTDRELAILQHLQPHLTQAYENAKHVGRLSSKLKRSEQALDILGAGWIELDDQMEIIHATPLAWDNLKMFFQGVQSDDARLPSAIEDWLSDLQPVSKPQQPIAPFILSTSAGRLILRLLPEEQSGQICLLTERHVDSVSPEVLETLGLTGRQSEVLYWICQGKSNAEIAVILKISVRTVTFHVTHIFEALGVANRTEASNVAMKHFSENH